MKRRHRRARPLAAGDAEAAPEASLGNSALVDHGVLGQYTGGDVARTRHLLTYYCESNAEDLATLSEALRLGNDTVMRIAHRIKGAAAMVGASEMAGIAERLERSARESPEFDGTPLAEELRKAASRVEAYVRGL